MSNGLNKVIIMGNLGADPEVKYISSGSQITTIRVATSESWKDKLTGEKQEKTEWHKITFFNRVAEIASQYLKKGSKVFIEGSLRTNKWKDQNGNDRYNTDIVASSLQLIMDSKRDDNQTQKFDKSKSESIKPEGVQPAVTFDERFYDDIPF